MSVFVASFVMLAMALSCVLIYVNRKDILVSQMISAMGIMAKPSVMAVAFMCGLYACHLSVYIALQLTPWGG